MIRVVLENLLLFLLPSLIYVVYTWITRPAPADGRTGGNAMTPILDDAPLMWLFAAGAILVVVTLVAFGSSSGGKPGQHYEPPSMKDGRIEQGQIK